MPHKDPEARKKYLAEYAKKNPAYARVKAWRAENPEKRAKQSKRYAEKHPDKIVAKTQRWRDNNPEKAAESSRKTRQNNRGRVLANKAKYRASKIDRTPQWLDGIQKLEIDTAYLYCAALRKIGVFAEVDHIVPLQGECVSGLHVPWNLQVIHQSENRLKSNSHAK